MIYVVYYPGFEPENSNVRIIEHREKGRLYCYNEFENILNYDDVMMLQCDDNGLRELPNLPKNLRILNCSFNLLTSLPVLPETLEELDFGQNEISFISDLPKNLRKLNCGYTEIAFLPELPITLTDLEANNCKLKTLPQLPLSIEFLDLLNNEIEELPKNLYRCVNLYYLNIKGNNMSSYPDLPPNIDEFHSDFSNDFPRVYRKILIS
jgi:Leucine-rich repeat (LRR) protein